MERNGHASGCWRYELGAGVPYNSDKVSQLLRGGRESSEAGTMSQVWLIFCVEGFPYAIYTAASWVIN